MGMIEEVDEAINAGNDALYSLEEALNYLNSARNWGFYDILGGGMISSMIKHSKMDDARQHLTNAKRSLELFKDELEDVNMEHNFSIDVGDFMAFADIFFDNIFADFAVQSKIKTTKFQVEQAIEKVNQILDDLIAIREQL